MTVHVEGPRRKDLLHSMTGRSMWGIFSLLLLVIMTGCAAVNTAPHTNTTAPATDPLSSEITQPTEIKAPPDTRAGDDPDGDGLDTYHERELLANASPCQMDIYVEIDWVNGTTPPSQAQLNELAETYADAPVRNPNGEQGIDLHLYLDEEVNETDSGGDILYDYLRSKNFDNAERGFHHALIVPEGPGDGFGAGDPGHFVAQGTIQNESDRFALQVFAHELGHSLGLTRRTFEGIDSVSYSYETYPSVMNYNGVHNSSVIDFSNGNHSPDDHDDWQYLSEQLYTPSTEELHRTDGEIPRDATDCT